MRKVALPEEVLIDVFGHHDENLRAIEKDVGVRVSARGTEVTVQGDPEVEAGEKLGFLPGDMAEKVDPYFRPLYDALYHLLDRERANSQLERGAIEIAPLAFMRGRTLNNSFVILDEAQNTTSEQMKMFLTRLGNNSKAVINGDVTQVDLPPGRTSGLIEAQSVVGAVPGIRFVYFDESDVVRHPLVQSIIKAYADYRNGHRPPEAEPGKP